MGRRHGVVRAGRRTSSRGAAGPRRRGSAWPGRATAALVVQEAVSRSTGGYAGLFDPARGQVEVAYYADDFVVLHEAAHAWFNGALLADRWANEAFASYYGARGGRRRSRSRPTGDALTAELKAARIPLNAWGPVGREDGDRPRTTPTRRPGPRRAIAERAGDDGLRAVWADAAGHVGAYQPPIATAPRADGADRPRRSTGRPTGAACSTCSRRGRRTSYDDLWRTWVARDDGPAAARRPGGRPRPSTTQVVGGGRRLAAAAGRSATRCGPGGSTRRPRCSTTPPTVLDQRADDRDRRGGGRADAAGRRCATAFEGADGFAERVAEADAELDAIAALRRAVAARPAGADPLDDRSGCGARPRGRPRPRPGPPFAPATSRARPRAADAAAVDLDQRRRRRPGPGDQHRRSSPPSCWSSSSLVAMGSAAASASSPPDAGPPHHVATGPRLDGQPSTRRDPYATLAATPDPADRRRGRRRRARGAEPD